MADINLVNSDKIKDYLRKADKTAIKKIQKALVIMGQSISVDGYLGKGTFRAINNSCEARLLGYLSKTTPAPAEVVTEASSGSTKDILMNFLAVNEGTHTHWNRGESDFTTAYGVYAKSFPNSKPVKFIRKIAKRNGIALSRGNIKKVDAAMSTQDRETLYELVYAFYCKNFLNPSISKHLGPKSTLALFSNSVNGGNSRGYKALQSALGVGVDGKWGRGSQRALENTKYSDDQLNQRMGDYMWGFYRRLGAKPKFSRFLKGWGNRLKNLGWRKR